jgi:hypothetical protein
MSDCPDCENKAVEAEEVKAEVEETKAEEIKAETEEVKAEDVAAEDTKAEDAADESADSVGIKILKSVGRIVAATIIAVGILFLCFKTHVMEYYYEQFDAGYNRELIEAKLQDGSLKGEKDVDYKYTITPRKDNNGVVYTVIITVDDKEFKMEWYPEWDKENNALKITDGDENESMWKEACNAADNKVRAKNAKAAPAAEVKEEAAPAKEAAPAAK